MRLTVTGAQSRTDSTTFKAYCLVSDNVGDAVCIRGDRIGQIYQVTKVNIDDPNSIRSCAVGVIRSKVPATNPPEVNILCTVQFGGELPLPDAGFDSGKLIFVGLDSRLTTTPPPLPDTGTRILQQVGTALANDVALLRIGSPVRLTPTSD